MKIAVKKSELEHAPPDLPDLPALIARVRELDQAATPGPWSKSVGVYQDPDGDSSDDDCFFGRGPVPFPHARALGEADAALIAEYRNAAPRLAAALEEQMAEVERLREVLLDFADRDCSYGDNCPPFGTRHGRCDGCKARAALERKP